MHQKMRKTWEHKTSVCSTCTTIWQCSACIVDEKSGVSSSDGWNEKRSLWRMILTFQDFIWAWWSCFEMWDRSRSAFTKSKCEIEISHSTVARVFWMIFDMIHHVGLGKQKDQNRSKGSIILQLIMVCGTTWKFSWDTAWWRASPFKNADLKQRLLLTSIIMSPAPLNSSS